MSGRRGGVILIAGPDGTGKSSVADALEAGPLAGREVVRFHQRAKLLPTHTHHDGPVLEPHAGRPYATWLSILKVLYLYVDVCLGWILRIRPVARRGGWVLLERGWWDMGVDPLRYRLGGGAGLVRALGRVIPRATLVLILEAPASVIRARSTELSEDELERQSAAWRTVLPRGWARAVLDVSQPLDAVVRDAATAVAAAGGPSTTSVATERAADARMSRSAAVDPVADDRGIAAGDATPVGGAAAAAGRAGAPGAVVTARARATPAERARWLVLRPITLLEIAIHRAGWGFADQALSSLTNFLVGFIVARSVSPAAFGAYALAFAVYVLVLNASRAISSLPLTIRFSVATPAQWQPAAAESGGLALLTGIGAGVACLGASLLASGTLQEAFLALAVVMPGLILQDLWRYAFFARRTGIQAFTNDGVWALIQVPLFGAILVTGHFSVGLAILAWGGSATVAAVIGGLQAGVWPRPRAVRAWWRAQSDIAGRFLGEALVSTGAATVQPYGITAVSGLATVGTLAAGELLLGPFNIIFQGTTLVAIPEGARLLRTSTSRLMRACMLWAVCLAGAAAAWGLVVLLLPEDVGTAILRQNWLPARSVLLPMAVALVGLGATAGATIGIRVLAAARRSLRTRIVITSIALVSAIIGAAAAGAVGAAVAMAIVSWLGVATWWWQFRLALAEYHPVEPVSAGRPDPAALVDVATAATPGQMAQQP